MATTHARTHWALTTVHTALRTLRAEVTATHARTHRALTTVHTGLVSLTTAAANSHLLPVRTATLAHTGLPTAGAFGLTGFRTTGAFGLIGFRTTGTHRALTAMLTMLASLLGEILTDGFLLVIVNLAVFVGVILVHELEFHELVNGFLLIVVDFAVLVGVELGHERGLASLELCLAITLGGRGCLRSRRRSYLSCGCSRCRCGFGSRCGGCLLSKYRDGGHKCYENGLLHIVCFVLLLSDAVFVTLRAKERKRRCKIYKKSKLFYYYL